MNTKIVSYLRENVDEYVSLKPWNNNNQIPVFLWQYYDFYELTLIGENFVLGEIKDENIGVDGIQKHITRVQEIANLPMILYFKEISRYRRKSLIENKVSFLIENDQMYLPFLGVDLKKVPEVIKKKSVQFSASTQAIYLVFLFNNNLEINQNELAKWLGYTPMTVSRALGELSFANLVTYKTGGKTGRSKVYRRIADPNFFIEGKKYVKSPVVDIVYVKEEPKGSYIAGVDALARLSMLNPPSKPVRALNRALFLAQNMEIIKNRDVIQDIHLFEVQLWTYDPAHFSNNDYVDMFSLYASLKDNHDERVEQALNDVLKGETWYTD
jgi:hypothetical protein